MSNDGITIYPDEETEGALERYQADEGASKSGAANQLIVKGANAHYRSPLSSVYRYLGFGFLVLGGVFYALNLGVDSGRLALFAGSFDLFAFLFIASAALMAYVEMSGISLRSLLRLSTEESEAAGQRG